MLYAWRFSHIINELDAALEAIDASQTIARLYVERAKSQLLNEVQKLEENPNVRQHTRAEVQ